MYNGGGSRVYLKTEVSSAEAGTMDYAVRNPLTFIVGVAGSEYDWLWSAHSDALWSASQKTVNEPCALRLARGSCGGFRSTVY